MKKTKFSYKLVAYFGLVVFVALFICAMLMRGKMQSTLEENMQLTSQQTMDEAVNEFQRYMKTLSLPIDIMCRRTELKKIDEKYSEETVASVKDALLSSLKVISQSERAYYSTWSGKYIQAKLVISPEGKKTGDYVVKENYDLSGKTWFTDCQDLESRQTVFANFTVPYVNEDGIEVFTVSQDLESGNVDVGVVAMDINAQALKDYINDIRLMNTGYTILVDKSGNIIVNNDRNSIISSTAEIPVWNELVETIDKGAADGTFGEENPVASQVCKIGGEQYCITVIEDAITGWYLVGILGSEENADELAAVTVTAVIALILGMVFAVLVALVIAYSISKELKKVTVAAEFMAKGDLTHELVVTRRDEFGQLENNFNVMRESISALICQVKENTEAILGIAKSVLEVSNDTKEIAGQVTEAITSVANGATEQAQSTAEANTEVEQLADSLAVSKNKVDIIGDKSRNTDGLSRQGTQIQQELIMKAGKAKSNAMESIATMSEMLKSIEKINYISDAIADITEQTNLLSLNASIEAARAGEAGRGFAVVAEEIRKLADQSNESTEEIKQILTEIMENSSQVEKSLRENGALQDEQELSVQESSKLFMEIRDAVGNLLEAVEEIETLNGEMNVAKDKVVGRMENIALVSETSAAASEEVTASAEQVNETMARVASYAQELDDIVNKLEDSINQFVL
ncbi:MAG: methyl-accepting chemotaxis protein [Lachnospiraceae bacterium]